MMRRDFLGVGLFVLVVVAALRGRQDDALECARDIALTCPGDAGTATVERVEWAAPTQRVREIAMAKGLEVGSSIIRVEGVVTQVTGSRYPYVLYFTPDGCTPFHGGERGEIEPQAFRRDSGLLAFYRGQA